MSRMLNADWSTIDMDEVLKLPVVVLAPTYQLQKDSGNGCAGDPPGFPTYFTRSVHTQHGNSPPRGFSMVISPPDGVLRGVAPAQWPANIKTWDEYRAAQDALMMRLWKRLPLTHPRTKAWIDATFAHQKHCYQNPNATGNWGDKTVIYPVPYYELRSFVDDKRFSDAWREKEKAAIAQANAEIEASAAKIAVPENHAGVVIVRRYYDDFVSTLAQLAGDVTNSGNWWETLAENPGPEKCPGQYGMPHPVNGTWCQFCGWVASKEKANV